MAPTLNEPGGGKIFKTLWCTCCQNPSHVDQDCAMNNKWCAICLALVHDTEECYFNGCNRCHHGESFSWQQQPKDNLYPLMASYSNK